MTPNGASCNKNGVQWDTVSSYTIFDILSDTHTSLEARPHILV